MPHIVLDYFSPISVAKRAQWALTVEPVRATLRGNSSERNEKKPVIEYYNFFYLALLLIKMSEKKKLDIPNKKML